jgi:hypothetical protein
MRDKSFTPSSTRPAYFPWGSTISVWPYPTIENTILGSIVAGSVYYVTGYTSVAYNGVVYLPLSSFTGIAGVTTYTTSFGDDGYVFTDAQLCDVHYLKEPTEIVDTTATKEFNDRICEIITSIACGSMNKDQYQIGMMMLKQLNDSYQATDSNLTGMSAVDDAYFDREDSYMIKIDV